MIPGSLLCDATWGLPISTQLSRLIKKTKDVVKKVVKILIMCICSNITFCYFIFLIYILQISCQQVIDYDESDPNGGLGESFQPSIKASCVGGKMTIRVDTNIPFEVNLLKMLFLVSLSSSYNTRILSRIYMCLQQT